MGLFDYRLLSFIGIRKKPKTPWKKYYDKSIMKINLKNENIYEYFLRKLNSDGYYNNIAISYYGKNITYKQFINYIDACANSFIKLGVKKFDIVTIISANIPEALVAFYALNKIGAVVNMLHPMLSMNEIKDALNKYETKYTLALDITLEKIDKVLSQTSVEKVIVLKPSYSMSILYKVGCKLMNLKNKKPNLKNKHLYLSWKKFITHKKYVVKNDVKKDDPALIFQSGGSTGKPKGIVLSNGNVNASTISVLSVLSDINSSDVILGIMPIFHGFGLEVSINDAFCSGAKVVLIPRFKGNKFHKLLIKYKPTVLVGVPTLFEALMNNKNIENIDLSYLKYVISGGDTLNSKKVEEVNNFLSKHKSKAKMLQGYGLTEAVASNSLDLKQNSKPGTIGIPLPGIYIGIFKPNTDIELKPNEDGEICICGPTVMLGYYDDENETDMALMHHKDGNIWLHTGDIGSMDKDGFLTYKQRLKRMIVTSGYNVYPSQIEEVLELHESVEKASVIGIPHKYKVEVPKAFIVLKKGYRLNSKLEKDLIKHCKENLAAYSVPKDFVAISKLPKTIVGKVDFKKLREKSLKEMEKKSNGEN